MIKRRQVMQLSKFREKKEEQTEVTKEEYNKLQRDIDQHKLAIRKLEKLSSSITDPDLKKLVAKNLADEEKEIIAINRKQLRRNGLSFFTGPTQLHDLKSKMSTFLE